MRSDWTPGYVQVAPGFDAAHCPDPVPAGYEWCMVYAGGSSATHAWDAAELALVAKLPRLPVWVPTPGTDDPVTAGNAFLRWLTVHNVPKTNARSDHTRVMWDMETGQEPDPAWLNKAAGVTAAAGYRNLVYGSISTLFGQPARSGYVVANPTGVLHLYQHPNVVATQYAFDVKTPGGEIDQDVAVVDLVRQMWQPS